MTRHLVIALALGACTDFSPVDRGVCGNGILEPGEDCDSSDPRCVHCALACTAATDCPTADYACGVDGFCHAPGGALAAPSAPVTFAADDLRITDLDRDGIGDVLGLSKTSIVVRYGDAAAALSAGDSFVTPAQSGPPAFGDLDGDGSIDATLSTRDGIVTYTSPFGVPSPIDVQSPILSDDGQPLDILAMFPVGPLQIGAFLEGDGIFALAIVDFLNPNAPALVQPCGGTVAPADFAIDTLDVYRASPDGAANVDLVVSFVSRTGKLCVTAAHGNSLAGFTLTDVTPPGPAPLHRPVLADLDGDLDPCPSLIDSDGGPAALRQWDGQLAGGHCTLAAAKTALPAIANTAASAVAIGRVPLVPAIGGFASDALVMSTGVYAFSPTLGFGPAYLSPRTLDRVAFGDIDGDGDLDVVLSAAGEPDLDILMRFPLGLELLRVATANPITTLTIADFDGNGIADVGYTERSGDHQRLMIDYGTTDRPLPPVQVATFSDVRSVTTLSFPDTEDQLGLAADLAIVQPGANGAGPTMSILHGSPQRTMLSFFDPRDTIGALFRGGVVGDFTGSDLPDLLAFGTTDTGTRAWRLAGDGTGLAPAKNDGVPVAGLVDCAAASNGVCLDDARYLAIPTAPHHDVVLALDRQAHAALLDPWAPSLVATPIPGLGGPPNTVPRSLYAVDLDGDGAPELVASFASATGDAGTVLTCKLNSGMPATCMPLVVPGAKTCIDAAPGNVGFRDRDTVSGAGHDLVVLCEDALYRVGGGEVELLARGTGLRGIRVGDVTGDGVDDVVALQGDAGIVVFQQCTSKNLDSCRISAATGGP